MTFVTKVWADRQTQYPNRRTLTNVSDPTDVKTVTVERDEGTVTQTGDALNADALNNLETRIFNMNASLVGTPIEYTLAAADWNSSTHLINVSVSGVTTTSNQEILPLAATSAANIQNNAALVAADIQDYGQATGSITLYAVNVPATDLKVRIIVRA